MNPLTLKPQHFPAKAKSITFLFMAGAPSQLDLLDYKPKFQELKGQHIPESLVKGERFAFIKAAPKLLGSPYAFKKCGQSGAEISKLLPYLGKVADDIAMVRSVTATQFSHAPAQIFMNCGHQIIGRPSMVGLADLWVRVRTQRPAWIRRAAVGREPSRRRKIMLGERVPANALSRCGV